VFRQLCSSIVTANVAGTSDDACCMQADQDVLEWDFRLPLIISEIREANADILCLQEVNRVHDLESQLPGYTCMYHKKDSDETRFGCPMDGCAILYRTQRFRPLSPPESRWAHLVASHAV
jgi:mRNA deadenylase 3'-5' endonuclease subunit Ccr4